MMMTTTTTTATMTMCMMLCVYEYWCYGSKRQGAGGREIGNEKTKKHFIIIKLCLAEKREYMRDCLSRVFVFPRRHRYGVHSRSLMMM